jgi:hypothetical protein
MRFLRVASAIGLSVSLFAGLAMFGHWGAGGPQSASAEYEYGSGPVTICHKGKTITVSGSSVGTRRHGRRLLDPLRPAGGVALVVAALAPGVLVLRPA